MPPLQFRLFGFPVEVRPAFLLLLAVYAAIGLQAGQAPWQIFVWWGVVFASILIHELGHAGMSRALRVPVHGIQLHGLGGEVSHAPSGAGPSLAISLAGPFTGLLVGVPLLAAWWNGVAPEGSAAAWILVQLVWVNVGWSLVNLLPMRPLDGGQALLAALWLVVPGFALPVVSAVGLLCAAGLVSIALWADEPFLLVLGLLAGLANVGGVIPRSPDPRE